MKKFIVLTVALLMMSTSAFALISLSKHDFTTQSWTGEICAPCHTPHNAVSSDAPLWSHATANNTWTMYTSATATMVGTPQTAPTNNSLACLSCHDGVTNMDDFVGTASLTPSVKMAGTTAMLGTDLSDDHPVSFTYDEAKHADGSYKALATITTLPFFGTTSDQLECGTCHDVHNNSDFSSMLRADPAGSVLCLTCHTK